ncbi:MAG TPA: DUF1800 domain-containing protein [Candidatus Binatia bacterium]
MTTPLTDEQKITHLLSRISFGATPADIEKVKSKGLFPYLEEQLHPEKIPDPVVEEKLVKLKTVRLSSRELLELYPPPQQAKAMGKEVSPTQAPRYVVLELQQAKLLRAVYSPRQLYEVMVDFWTNHFNVFAGKGADRWLVTSYDRDTIRPYALGRFRDLLLATAKSPAMLFYLDNWLSVSPEADANRPRGNPKPAARQGINENYARELMELHTLGVDGGYTQKDVTEVARCFTGWTIRRPRGQPEFLFDARAHDRGEKVVLGARIAPGGGMEDGVKVIDLLARHPSTGRFIATKLARRLVSDDPPAPVIAQAAGVFRESDGDIKEVIRAIVRSPEFFSPEALKAKIKKPLEFVASALRAVGAETDVSPALLRYLVRMGEPLFLSQPPTGFPDVGSIWTSPDMLLTRMNFTIDLTANRIPGTKVKNAETAAELVAAPEFQRR